MHIATGSIVAIKRVSIDNDLEDIIKEITFMKGCKSPYIVKYHGSYVKDGELWVCSSPMKFFLTNSHICCSAFVVNNHIQYNVTGVTALYN